MGQASERVARSSCSATSLMLALCGSVFKALASTWLITVPTRLAYHDPLSPLAVSMIRVPISFSNVSEDKRDG